MPYFFGMAVIIQRLKSTIWSSLREAGIRISAYSPQCRRSGPFCPISQLPINRRERVEIPV